MTRKTTLMSVLFALVAFVANAGSGIYLTGTMTNWASTAEELAQWEFQNMNDGNYYLIVDEVLPADVEFKVLDKSDGERWLSINPDYKKFGLGDKHQIYTDNGDNQLSFTPNGPLMFVFSKIDGDFLKIDTADYFYLKSKETNDWAATDDWHFAYEGNGVYRLVGEKLLNQEFKIGGKEWDLSFGANDEKGAIVANDDYMMWKGGNSGNIQLLRPINATEIQLTVRDEAYLHITGETVYPESVYFIAGENSVELLKSGEEGDYIGEVEFNTLAENGLTAWRIAEGMEEGAYTWGLEADATEESTEGTFVFGGTGVAMTSYTSFTVKFNILSGAYSLTKTSSVADVEAADVKVIGGAGEIRVEGAAEGVKVFALSGALLSEGETIVKVPAGIYLVSVGSKVVKVAVK